MVLFRGPTRYSGCFDESTYLLACGVDVCYCLRVDVFVLSDALLGLIVVLTHGDSDAARSARHDSVLGCIPHLQQALIELAIHPGLVPPGLRLPPGGALADSSFAACLKATGEAHRLEDVFDEGRRLQHVLTGWVQELEAEVFDIGKLARLIDYPEETTVPRVPEPKPTYNPVEEAWARQRHIADQVLAGLADVDYTDAAARDRLVRNIEQNASVYFVNMVMNGEALMQAVLQAERNRAGFIQVVRGGLREVTRVQGRMFRIYQIRRMPLGTGYGSYNDTVDRLERICGHIDKLVQLPKAYLEALREIIRRKKFAKRYGADSDRARKRLSRFQNTEIARRQDFHNRFGQYLPAWPGFAAFADFPSTTITRPEPFDLDLPDVTVEEFSAAAQMVERGLGDVGLQHLSVMMKGSKHGDSDLIRGTGDSVLGLGVDIVADDDGDDEVGDPEQVRELQLQLIALHTESSRLQTEKTQLLLRAEAAEMVARPEPDARLVDAAAAERIAAVQAELDAAAAERIAEVQAELDAQRAELATVRTNLDKGTDQLSRLTSRLAETEAGKSEAEAGREKLLEMLNAAEQRHKQAQAAAAAELVAANAEIESLRERLELVSLGVAEPHGAAAVVNGPAPGSGSGSSLRSSWGAADELLASDVNASSTEFESTGSPPSELIDATNLPRITFTGSFQVGDYVLLMPWAKNQKLFVAFQKKASPRQNIVSNTSLQKLTASAQKGLHVGQITSISHEQAYDGSNPYALPVGTDYNVLEVEPWKS